MTEKINIGLVEDQALFREGMKAIMAYWENIEVIFESDNGYSVVDKLKSTKPLPDVLLVDLSLPPDGEKEFSGIDVTNAVLQSFPEMKILILSVHQDENFIAQLIEHGAHGYLVKDCDPQELKEAIVAVHTKGSYINERTLKAIQNNMGRKSKLKNLKCTTTQLTKREEEVLCLICLQHTSEKIAEKLFISVKTVNGHRNNLLEKTQAKNTAGLVIYALKNNLVDL